MERGNYADSKEVVDNPAEPPDEDGVERGTYVNSKEVGDNPANPKGAKFQDNVEAVDGPRMSGPLSPLLPTRFTLLEVRSPRGLLSGRSLSKTFTLNEVQLSTRLFCYGNCSLRGSALHEALQEVCSPRDSPRGLLFTRLA